MLQSLFRQFDTVVMVDTETTGFRFRSDEIIELGLVVLSPDGTVREEDRLVALSPGRTLPRRITELTGITEQMLAREGVAKKTAAELFAEALRSSRPLVAAYNAHFDLCFLYYFLRELGMASVLQRARFLDVMTVYRDRRDYPHRLQDAVAAYGAAGENSHRACDDARAALSVLIAMERERDDLDRYVNLFGYNPKYGIPSPRIGSVRYAPRPYERCMLLYE